MYNINIKKQLKTIEIDTTNDNEYLQRVPVKIMLCKLTNCAVRRTIATLNTASES